VIVARNSGTVEGVKKMARYLESLRTKFATIWNDPSLAVRFLELLCHTEH